MSKYLTSRKAGEFTLSNPLEEEILENSISALQAVNIQIAVKGRYRADKNVKQFSTTEADPNTVKPLGRTKSEQVKTYLC